MDNDFFMLRKKNAGLTGVILAGGKKRIGEFHPALLPFRRERLINRQFRLMRPVCKELILVTDEPKLFLSILDPDVRMITDFYSGFGPLGGIHAALSLACNDQVWLAGCDMPFLSSHAAHLLLNRKIKHNLDAVIPSIHDRLYPLHGIFDRRRVDVIPELAGSGQGYLPSFLDRIRYDKLKEWNFRKRGIELSFVYRASTQEAYEEALQMKC